MKVGTTRESRIDAWDLAWRATDSARRDTLPNARGAHLFEERQRWSARRLRRGSSSTNNAGCMESAIDRPIIGAPTVVLVPTELELARLADLGGLPVGLALTSTCGFGVIAAAARTAQVLAEIRPSRVLLLGIAGTYDEARAPVGSALEFDEVAIEGIGVGEGERFVPPPKLGFPQWPGSQELGTSAIFDRIALARPKSNSLLVTTCAASIDEAHAASRRSRFPTARAEDMEGFAVALACALANVPLRIVRGISNVVGDRDSRRWRIPNALAAARGLAIEILESNETWSNA